MSEQRNGTLKGYHSLVYGNCGGDPSMTQVKGDGGFNEGYGYVEEKSSGNYFECVIKRIS